MEDLWKWSRLEIRLNTFRQSTILYKKIHQHLCHYRCYLVNSTKFYRFFILQDNYEQLLLKRILQNAMKASYLFVSIEISNTDSVLKQLFGNVFTNSCSKYLIKFLIRPASKMFIAGPRPGDIFFQSELAGTLMILKNGLQRLWF